MAIQTYTQNDQRTNVVAPVDFLENAEPREILIKLFDSKPMPKNKAETVKWKRAVPFPALTTVLTEGVSPIPRQLQWETVEMTMKEWGDAVEASDRVRELSEDPVVKVATKELSKQAVNTMETILWDLAKAGTSVRYANGTARTDVNTALSLSKIRAAISGLDDNYATPIEEILSASVKYNTSPCEAAYIAVGSTRLKNDIRNLPGFLPVAEYGTVKPISKYEFGSTEECRFILSPLYSGFLGGGSATANGMQTTGGSVDVYPLVIFGKGYCASVPLKGSKSVEMFVHNTADKNDILNQRDIVGAKYWFNGVRLNESWGTRIECGVTSL